MQLLEHLRVLNGVKRLSASVKENNRLGGKTVKILVISASVTSNRYRYR